MKDLYLLEVRKELAKHAMDAQDIITEKDIVSLPEPVQKYFRYCGFLGKEKMMNAQVIWEDVFLKTSPKNNWMSINCFQFNSVAEPMRIAYMKHRIMGMFPFEGRDKFQDAHGNMRIKLFKVITIADATGKEMDESGLVTILAEALLVPGYALQPYIQWIAIDSHTAKAVLTYNSIQVSGLFYFNDLGELLRFESNDRNYSEKGTEYKNYKWSAVASDYVEKNGMKFPSHFKAVWHTEDGEYEYYKGTIVDIKYNVKFLG